MSFSSRCILSSKCSYAGDPERCDVICYPYTVAHGINGEMGIMASANIPDKYKKCTIETLPKETDNQKIPFVIRRYCSRIMENVSNGVGLYFFSVPNEQNPLGTGTGKTTSAITILNEYLKERIILHVQRKKIIDHLPGFFIRAADFQNIYNAQFKGNQQAQEEAAGIYNSYKKKMIQTDLLVYDDIGIRSITESFENELTEIIDRRVAEGKATLYTSNCTLKQIENTLGDRIASRIAGSTYQIPFKGRDWRKEGLYK